MGQAVSRSNIHGWCARCWVAQKLDPTDKEKAMVMEKSKQQSEKISKIRSVVTEQEWAARVDLAACYQLSDHYAMSDMIYTHITARVPDEPNSFLINPNGMLFDEMTAVDNVLCGGYAVTRTGMVSSASTLTLR